MKFDDFLREVGEFGTYQKIVYGVMCCIPATSVVGMMILNVVILSTPDHRCKLPGIANDTYVPQSYEHELLINATIPSHTKYGYDRCHLYYGHHLQYDNYSRPLNASLVTCSEWVYDDSVYKHTFTKQENLVCSDALLVSHAQLAFYFGVLVGSIIFGQLADTIGRKKTLYICLLLLLASSIAITYAPEYYSFVVLQFVMGTSCLGTWMAAFVTGLEFVGPSKRVLTGCIMHIFGSLGAVYLVLMAYLFRDWQKVELSMALPCAVYIFYICFIPESPRWLLSNGRKNEARDILRKLAKRNGKELTEMTLNLLESEDKSSSGKIWQLLSTKTLAVRTAVICFNWIVVGMAYYGALLNVGNLGGDYFLNFFLLNVVGFPVKVFSIPLMEKLGRKRLYVIYMMIAGIVCVFTIYPVLKKDQPLHWLLIACSVMGQFCVTGGWETLYVWSAELYPTVVRNVGMGTSSAFARVGSMIAPYIAKSAALIEGDISKAVPLIIFGVAAFIGAFLSLVLPETLKRKLPDTINEADNFARNIGTELTRETLIPRKQKQTGRAI